MSDLRDFDIANYLDNKEIIAEYLTQVLEDGDVDAFISAINDIARAKGISSIAKETNLNRESLYKAFKKDSKPRFDTVLKVLNALDVKLVAVA